MSPKAENGDAQEWALLFCLIMAYALNLESSFLLKSTKKGKTCGYPHVTFLRESVDAFLDSIHRNPEVLLSVFCIEVDVAL